VNVGAYMIRDATPADGAALARLWVRTWRWAYRGMLSDAFLAGLDEAEREREFVAGMERGFHRLRIIESAGVTAGFSLAGKARDPELPAQVGEMLAINLDPDFIGKGLGRRLLAATVDDLRAAGFNEAVLWVLTENARARRFYEIAGWQGDGTTYTDTWRGQDFLQIRYRIKLA
jgi:ribosomal protein S18 acetylase RimI-like enzyme